MQNKNSQLNTVLLIIIIILLGVLIFWKMGDTDGKKLYSDENKAVDFYDPLVRDNNITPTPTPTPVPTPTKKTSYTVSELYKEKKLTNVCGVNPADNKVFTIEGYASRSYTQPGSIWIQDDTSTSSVIHLNAYMLNKNASVLDSIGKININPQFSKVKAQGILTPSESIPSNMTTCVKTYFLDLTMLTVI